MPTSLELGNPNNWEQVYTNLLQATDTGGSTYIPIQPFDLPILLDKHILAVRTFNPNASPRWYLGCWVSAIVEVASVFPGASLSLVDALRQPARINRTTLIQIPEIAPQYRLRIEIPIWFQSMSLIVWQYIGPP